MKVRLSLDYWKTYNPSDENWRLTKTGSQIKKTQRQNDRQRFLKNQKPLEQNT